MFTPHDIQMLALFALFLFIVWVTWPRHKRASKGHYTAHEIAQILKELSQ